MSLVAYAGSDESDEEEQETKTLPGTSLMSNTTSGHISDEEDHFAGVSSSTGRVSYPSVFSAIDPDTGEASHPENINSTSLTALDGLPAPRKKKIMEENMPQETELEAEVLAKASELADAPKPPKKQRQPAKISIPSLNDVDMENSASTKMKLKPSEKSSGLFSLLPAPVHSSKKEINRPLVPHSLTKKNACVKKETQVKEISSSLSSSLATVPSQKSQSAKDVSRKHLTTYNALTGYDSDSDDDENIDNFFSLGQNPQSSSTNEKACDAQTAAVDSTVEMTGKEATIEGPRVDLSETVRVRKVELGAINDAPLDFSTTAKLHSWTRDSYSHLLPVGPSAPVGSTAIPTTNSELNIPLEIAQSNKGDYDPTAEDENVNSYSTAVSSEDLEQLMRDKDFQRMHGKRKRGLEEEINFVDARVDDYVDPTEVSKHMTEETEYVSAKKDKDNMPTSQQKRKKQITYLAYQAKEKEFELKNTWAQNRQTKKQTQSKYGF